MKATRVKVDWPACVFQTSVPAVNDLRFVQWKQIHGAMIKNLGKFMAVMSADGINCQKRRFRAVVVKLEMDVFHRDMVLQIDGESKTPF